MKSALLLGLSLVGSSAFAACDLAIVSVQSCDATGAPSAPAALGSTYFMRVDWTVTGVANAAYVVRFRFANQEANFTMDARNPGSYWAYAAFGMPLDGAIPLRVTLDPTSLSGDTSLANNVRDFTYRPGMPSLPIAYFAPRNLRATQTFNVHVANTSIQTLQLLMGAPVNETNQSVVRVTPPVGSTTIQTQPFWQPVRWKELQNPAQNTTHSITQSADTISRNVRLNEPKINQTATWAAFVGLPATVTRFLQPEAAVQSTDPLIGSFVNAALGANYKTTMNPMAAARKLFLRTAASLVYEFPSPSSSAKEGLQVGRGDCGIFSALYVAALKRAGIPARQVFGWREGANVVHVWTEMYMPGVGWIPQDPTDSDGWDPTGTYAYAFGVVPDLNARVSVSKAATHRLSNGQTMGGLQVGAWYYWNASGPVPTTSWTTSLVSR